MGCCHVGHVFVRKGNDHVLLGSYYLLQMHDCGHVGGVKLPSIACVTICYKNLYLSHCWSLVYSESNYDCLGNVRPFVEGRGLLLQCTTKLFSMPLWIRISILSSIIRQSLVFPSLLWKKAATLDVSIHRWSIFFSGGGLARIFLYILSRMTDISLFRGIRKSKTSLRYLFCSCFPFSLFFSFSGFLSSWRMFIVWENVLVVTHLIYASTYSRSMNPVTLTTSSSKISTYATWQLFSNFQDSLFVNSKAM